MRLDVCLPSQIYRQMYEASSSQATSFRLGEYNLLPTIGMKEPPPTDRGTPQKGPLVLLGNKKCKLPVHPLVQSRSLVLEKLVSLGIALHKWHQI